jgi:dipeptidyl aminopeptidase/acylaminoacyl peptidase
MSEKTKRIIVIIAFIGSVILIAWLLYIVFFRVSKPDEISPVISEVTEETSGTLPSSGEGGARAPIEKEEPGEFITQSASEVAIGGVTVVTPLTLTATKEPHISSDGNALNYYDPSDGKFYNVDKNGNVRSLLNKPLPNAKEITWSPTSEKAVVEFPDGANVMVDFQSQDIIPLPQHWEDFDFDPQGQQIAAKSIGVDPSNRWLVIASTDGSRADTIESLGQNQDKVDVSWSPNNQVVAFSDTGITLSGFGRKQILPIGKHRENLPGLVVEGFSFDPVWSPRGTQILYSTAGPASNYQPQIWLVDGEANTMGQNRRSLPLNTWGDKCTYSDNSTAYCAVPQNLPYGSGLQRQLALGEPDSLYRINTKTGAISLVAVPENNIPMTDLSVSDDGSTLFFQHEINGTLSSIRLE